uniref:MIF4G domain-containing protein n=1 Tax=Panagrellus redivivus TaxID=6233 RepID=A0A7E4VM60_PANRE
MNSLTDYESRLNSFLAISENEDAVFKRQTYDRSLVQILRDANKVLNLYKCPVPDDRLKRLGLNRENGPRIPAIAINKNIDESQNPPAKTINAEKPPKTKKQTTSSEDLLLMEATLKTLHPTTFASVANTLISKEYWKYPEMAAMIVDAAMARPGLATIYADLVFNIRRTTLYSSNQTSAFAQRVVKKVVENFRVATTKTTEKNWIDTEDAYHVISIIAELYRLHMIENGVINQLCIELAFKWAKRLNYNEKIKLSTLNRVMIEIGINFITAIGLYYRDSGNSTNFRLENYILYLTNLKASVPPKLEKKIIELEELAARNFVRKAPF